MQYSTHITCQIIFLVYVNLEEYVAKLHILPMATNISHILEHSYLGWCKKKTFITYPGGVRHFRLENTHDRGERRTGKQLWRTGEQFRLPAPAGHQRGIRITTAWSH